VQLGGQERDQLIEVWAEVASLKAQQKSLHRQMGKRQILHDLSDRMASVSPTHENFGQMKANFEWTIEATVGMKAQDEQCRPVASSERKAGGQQDRQDQKDWEIVMADQDGVLVDIKSSEEKKDLIHKLMLSSQCIDLREQCLALLGFIQNDDNEMNDQAKWAWSLGSRRHPVPSFL
jgi:hypothetical protein